MISDSYGRPVTSIRVSVTQRCNLNCFYCHREGEKGDSSSAEMTPKEIERIIGIAASFGVRKVKLTGGEPLMRKDMLEIVEGVRNVKGISEVSMTTNGTRLHDLAEPLKEAGLMRVNVSLDTLNPRIYRTITGVNALNRVVSGVRKTVEVGLTPVKLNMVLLKDINEREVGDMIEFAGRNSVILQLIELESARKDDFYMKHHSDMTGIEGELKKKAKKVTVRRMHHRRKYTLHDDTEVEIVRPMHNTEFCKYCNRTRVTSDGKFKPCLFRSNNLIDFLTPMRNGASTEDLKGLFLDSVRKRKPYFI